MKKRIFAILLVAVMMVFGTANTFAARNNYSNWFDLDRINAIDVAEDLTKRANREEVALLIAELCKGLDLLPNKRVIEFADRREFSSSTARELIEDLSSTGIVCGYPDGEFKPEKRITRAEALAIVIRTVDYFSLKTETYRRGSSFTDTEGHWAEVYCNRAYEEGLISGRGDGRFYPDDDITREEIVTILVNLMGESNNPLIAAIDKIFDLEFDNSYREDDEDEDNRDRTDRPVIDWSDYNNDYDDDYINDEESSTGHKEEPPRPIINRPASSEGAKPQKPDLSTTDKESSTSVDRPVVDLSGNKPARPII